MQSENRLVLLGHNEMPLGAWAAYREGGDGKFPFFTPGTQVGAAKSLVWRKADSQGIQSL